MSHSHLTHALGLTDDEVAFYDALGVNDSAVQVLGDEVLRKIAEELTRQIRASVTIDWTVKESVRADIRRRVKRILRKYGYPVLSRNSSVPQSALRAVSVPPYRDTRIWRAPQQQVTAVGGMGMPQTCGTNQMVSRLYSGGLGHARRRGLPGFIWHPHVPVRGP